MHISTDSSITSLNANADEPAQRRVGLVQFLPGWMVSMCLHFIFMFVLASFALPMVPVSNRISLQATESDENELASELEFVSIDSSAIAKVDVADHFEDLLQNEELSSDQIDLSDMLDGASDLDPMAGFQGTDFFGIEGYGDRFAFVIDRSSSMTGDKFTQACQELLSAVEQLRPSQFFYVVFFDRGTLPMFGEKKAKMLPASAENLSKLRVWVESLKVGSGTKPFESIQQALKLRPDTLYLLSDGRFNSGDNTVSYFSNQKRKKVRKSLKLHTVGFGHKDDGTLENLAKQHEGTFRFVAVK